jgi:ABC-2 type transport system ATP-binding protein
VSEPEQATGAVDAAEVDAAEVEADLEPIVHTAHLTKYFGTTAAVRDLNLVVERGSITGIVGPNGAGKTTTFLMLSTLLMPTHGEAAVCGFDPVAESEDVRRRLGYMPDFFGIYDDVTCHEYLQFFAAAYGIGPAKRKGLSTDLLELVDLTGKRDAYVNSLSRGMKQRLCLARALVHDPELLILDEPASGLDPRARVELRGLMLELQRMGKTILISSHILSELEEVCSHVAILEAGTLIASGAPGEIGRDLQATRRFTIRLAGDAGERLDAAVAEIPDARLTRSEERGIELELSGDDRAASEALRHLISAGIPVLEFSEVRTGIEEIFMRVTKGIVS